MGLLAMVPVAGIPAAITADILVAQVLSTSIAARIAYSYGYDATDPKEQEFIQRLVQRSFMAQAAKAKPSHETARAANAVKGCVASTVCSPRKPKSRRAGRPAPALGPGATGPIRCRPAQAWSRRAARSSLSVCSCLGPVLASARTNPMSRTAARSWCRRTAETSGSGGVR